MRHSEILARPAAPETHPFVSDITIDPAEFYNFERAMEGCPEVMLLCGIDQPESWLVHVACASEAVRRRLINAWG